MSDETIDVGKSRDGKNIFIGFPNAMYDKAKTSFTERTKHFLFMTREEAEAIVEMLQVELNGQPQ